MNYCNVLFFMLKWIISKYSQPLIIQAVIHAAGKGSGNKMCTVNAEITGTTVQAMLYFNNYYTITFINTMIF